MSALSLVRNRIFIALLALGVALVVAAACGGGDDGGETPPAGETAAAEETPAGGEATAEIKMIPTIRFDTSELTIADDTDVTITADNTDEGFSHNFAVYASEADAQDPEVSPIAQTEIGDAPFTDSVTVNLAAGEYFFRCEVHPDLMTGTLIAQ